MTDEINYVSYLRLPELLELQTLQSKPAHSDELLFIVVHQSSELWFKVILQDIDGLIDALVARDSGLALWRAQRVNSLMRIVSEQLSSLETLPPQHFAQFRTYLGTSSGSQSVQFRAIEAASGLRDPHFLRVLQEHGDVPDVVMHALSRPPLEDLFVELVESGGVSLEGLLTGPAPTVLYFLAEALLNYDEQFALWRFKHVQLVERVIGPLTGGTGGTLGSRYLLKTVDQRFFPRLWAVRGKFFGPKN